MRKTMNILFLLLIPVCLMAGTMTFQHGGSGTARFEQSGGADYSDIIFYDSCDSVATPHSPDKGEANSVILTGGEFALGEPLGGSSTNSIDNQSELQYDAMRFSTSSTNIDMEQGVVGFYFCPDSATDDQSRAFGYGLGGEFVFVKYPSGSEGVGNDRSD
jgi:hypothetical protein